MPMKARRRSHWLTPLSPVPRFAKNVRKQEEQRGNHDDSRNHTVIQWDESEFAPCLTRFR
ncbi:hypothetical protein BN874_1940007 [Candidatus Contendobacter odensis Run_B_J11]|uniref:Uncharacterized protein n=1 Tax=Candidatus Contendobacter odensis Run_B_J11 TaxID=1400861 RepID=A0A7U7GAV0_9GAMM|nr:hypothetical protein BN874_1940007 [Candidatus Contendobacter odensis Run_B_J11]